MTMNKSVSVAAFVVGLAVVFWVGRGYVGLSPLALGMTVLIAVVYMVGAMELVRFERATTALRRALSAIPAQLSHPGEWLRSVPLTLQTSVRLRIEGERVGLLLFFCLRSLGRDINQHPLQFGLGLPYVSQCDQSGFAALNAAFTCIDDANFVRSQVKALLTVTLVGVVHHHATRLLQTRP